MSGFWIVAGALIALALAFVLTPVLMHRRRTGRWAWAGVLAAVATVPISVGLYFHVSNWNPQVASRAAEGARLVQQLAQRLEQSPDDVRGWRLLGNSYMALGQYREGRAAYAEAWRRSPERDDDLTVAYAEAMVLTERGALTGEAGRLFDQVLGREPANPKALWYGGLAAAELGRNDTARERWLRLLAQDLPDQVRGVVQAQLAALQGGAPSAGAAAATDGPQLRLRVTLGDAAAAQSFEPNAALFLFARSPGGGPPLAVRREPASALPGEFVLSNANSMLPGTSLGDFAEITVIARLSRSGEPTERPGDWYAEARVDPNGSGVIDLVIDRAVQ